MNHITFRLFNPVDIMSKSLKFESLNNSIIFHIPYKSSEWMHYYLILCICH